MKIYIPFCGIGLGHAFRAMQVGKELQKRGHKILYATYEPTCSKLKSRGFRVIKVRTEAVQCQHNETMDLVGTILNTSSAMALTPLMVKEHMDIIKKFKPDAVLSDTFFSALIAGKLSGLPVALMTNQTHVSSFFPGKRYAPVRALIDASYAGFVKMADKFIVPDLPMPNSLCRYNMKFFGSRKKFCFVGPIVQKKPENVKAIKFKRETILVTLGGSGIKADIEKYLKGSPEINFVVVNSPFEKKDKNIIYKKYVKDYFPYLKGCSALLTHGGHTSIMEAVAFGKPILGISLKGYAERENNLLGITNSGNGSMVRDMAKEISNLGKYRKRALLLQKLARKNNGAKKAADIMEHLIK